MGTTAIDMPSYVLTHFMPLISFDTPENIKTPEVFWCFQGVSKEISGMKWGKKILSSWLCQVVAEICKDDFDAVSL